MFKKIVLAACAVLLCASVWAGGKKEQKGQSDYRVAFIARAQADSFAAWLGNEMRAAAAKYPDIKFDLLDAQADNALQNSMIETCIANSYDAIIVQPNNGEAQRPYVEQIVDAGIIAVTTNARISGIEGASSVDADPYLQGKVCADLAVEQVPENGRVVVILMTSGNFHSDARREAWQECFFDKRPDVTLLAEDFAHGNKDEAMALMEDWSVAYGKIDAVITVGDNMAAGALEAVKDNPLYDGMLAYGVDGTPEGCLLIKEGRMTATCLQSAIDLAALNLDTVHKLLTGESQQIDADIDAILITKDNVDQYIELYRERGLITD